jgi:hypothetical protein
MKNIVMMSGVSVIVGFGIGYFIGVAISNRKYKLMTDTSQVVKA